MLELINLPYTPAAIPCDLLNVSAQRIQPYPSLRGSHYYQNHGPNATFGYLFCRVIAYLVALPFI